MLLIAPMRFWVLASIIVGIAHSGDLGTVTIKGENGLTLTLNPATIEPLTFFAQTIPFLNLQVGKKIYMLESYTLVPKKGKNPAVKEVDLSRFFQKKVKLQKAGSCHLYAGIAYVEATCKRLTGIDIDFAEDYYFYRLAREALKQNLYKNEDNRLVDFSLVERGWAEMTINRIRKGEIALTKDFVQEKDEAAFERAARAIENNFISNAGDEITAQLRKAAEALPEDKSSIDMLPKIQKEKSDKMLATVTDEWDCDLQGRCRIKLEEAFDEEFEESDGLTIPETSYANDTNAQKCVKSIGEMQKIQNPSSEEMTALLDRNRFFICNLSDPENYSNLFSDTRSFVKYQGDREKIEHTTIVYGYRQLGKNIEFLVRDSNLTTWPGYVVTGCSSIQYAKEAGDI